MAPKKERDEALADFSARIFSAMLEEVLMDVVLQSHQEVARFNAVCEVCHTRCNSSQYNSPACDQGLFGADKSCVEVHLPDTSAHGTPSGSQLVQPESQATTVDPAALSGNGTAQNANGFSYFECTNCGRSIASNRYAPHLSGCMGLGNSRRGAVRNSTSKARLEAGRSASPFMGSELGNLSDEGKPTPKGKGKSRAKQADDAEFSLHRKRNGSPSSSPAKKAKKQKTGTHSALPLSHTNSHTRIPSKLRESSVVSSTLPDQQSNSPDSQASSPAMSASTPSAFSIQSPILAGAGVPGKHKLTKNGNGMGSMRFSPPQPPPPVIRGAEDYFVDVEGDETGSSTDSDSD
ncbi:hypothetical protein BC835DRAFT_1417615 [Cytidiella melzeri]|nr:hypothetical protein BC835DRAFT_1417615 [Cytidiella melzeri]